jgi:hypothetical protein
MCTIILKDQVEHSIIAEKQFIVYKFGKKNAVGDFISAFREHRYLPGVEEHFWMTYEDLGDICDNTEKKYRDSIPEDQRVYVVEGAHAFTSLKRLKRGQLWRDRLYHIGEFIIPVNARYYINECGNIVSSAIIFKKFI